MDVSISSERPSPSVMIEALFRVALAPTVNVYPLTTSVFVVPDASYIGQNETSPVESASTACPYPVTEAAAAGNPPPRNAEQWGASMTARRASAFTLLHLTIEDTHRDGLRGRADVSRPTRHREVDIGLSVRLRIIPAADLRARFDFGKRRYAVDVEEVGR